MNIGYIGLGVMGGRMADRLMTKGHTVTGFNRTKPKAQWLLDRGIRWGASPRPPPATRPPAAAARAPGADMIDCPVAGSVSVLEQGKLTMMVGGDKATFERV